jgi:hypothetical protein
MVGRVTFTSQTIHRRFIAALTQRIPELEAPRVQEPSESPIDATEQPGRVEQQTPLEGVQEGSEHVSWWRRLFSGA